MHNNSHVLAAFIHIVKKLHLEQFKWKSVTFHRTGPDQVSTFTQRLQFQ